MLKPSIEWMSLVNIMLNERCQAQRPHIVPLHLYEMSKIGKSTEVESDQELPEEGAWEVRSDGERISFGDDETVLVLDHGDGCTTL